jgi:RNA polymerase sigma-70 factor, ECF subfamily
MSPKRGPASVGCGRIRTVGSVNPRVTDAAQGLRSRVSRQAGGKVYTYTNAGWSGSVTVECTLSPLFRVLYVMERGQLVLAEGKSRMDERALIGHARAGDSGAFATLFEAYYGPITSYLYRMVGDRDTADDLAQDTFIKAHRALGRTDAELNVRSWLYRIATNTASSYHRCRRLLRWLPLGPSTPEPSIDMREAESLGERELIEVVLGRIKSSHSSALLMRHYHGLSLEKTAEALGVSPNVAKARLFRACKAFAREYEALARGREDRR